MKEKQLLEKAKHEKGFEQMEYKTLSCPDCKESHTIYHQPDNHPEYYTNISLVCKNCCELIVFEIPVN